MNPPLARRIEAVRRFNRFYTRQIGILREGYLRTPYTLSEVRLIYELAHHERTTATHLGQELGLDGGYLSRMLAGFEKRGLVQRKPSADDRRRALLSLTTRGQKAFAKVNAASRAEIEAMLGRLHDADQERVLDAMQTIELLLGAPPEHRVPYILRPHHSGDIGWMVHRHGVVYNQEFGWDEQFEALVAEIAADFLRTFDAKRERCWIAERDGENVGCVCLVRHPKRKGVARLRLLLVEPRARGLGIGKRLVQECTRFARQSGYRAITLWTNSVLDAARRLYEEEGYHLVDEKPHRSFGHDLVGQTWELELPATEHAAPRGARQSP
ncbi:MAG TPA: helix-turn-helix domain-containing GNAT family N-acetyltransferase [Gemmatimonadaceae bacterium]|nr:helix-turn-helix domain-containing GNAT family N-acetyltransferase [Gemmatimonadaceae bacterium]